MGICKADTKVRDYVNQAQERLMIDPLAPEEGWYGSWVRMQLSASNVNGSAYVTTPREVARLIVTAVCQQPIPIRNGFYEFLQFSPGLQPKTCGTGCGSRFGSQFEAIERDNVPTLAPLLATPQMIRIYPSDARDAGKRVLVQGKDQNGIEVLTTDPGTGKSAPGEYMVITFPFVTSVNTFSTISGVMKDETFGPITLFQVDATTAAEVALSSMEPNEGTGWYRRYGVFGIPCVNTACCVTVNTIQLTAQARLDFIPVANENDYLSIQNLPALNEECKAVKYGNMDTGGAVQLAALHHSQALSYLNGQLDQMEGKTSTAIAVPIFGSNRLRPSFR